MLAICITTLALVAAEASVTPIAVTVVGPQHINDSLMNLICAEAEAIWAPAGIAIQWNRDAAKDEATRLVIEVTIEDRPVPVGHDGALGWVTFTRDIPDRFIHLSRASAEDLLRSSPNVNDATITAHEATIGRALGRALAHELGHYVLRSKVHTRRGLMRAVWTPDQTFAPHRDGFELTSQERDTAAGNVRMEVAAPATRHESQDNR